MRSLSGSRRNVHLSHVEQLLKENLKTCNHLNATEAAVPKSKAIHAIVDNDATHKHPKVKQWLARHPR